MKFVTFTPHGDQTKFGLDRDGRYIDLHSLVAACGEILPQTLLDFIRVGDAALTSAREALAGTSAATLAHFSFDPAKVRLEAPLPRPGKILCSGINYHSHFRENPNAKMPEEPFFFAKMPSTVIGPGAAIVLPRRSKQVDYEVEFAVVIGRSLKAATPSTALSAVFGYTILNDVSARDVQFKDNQITLGKNFDTFTPLGPCIVSADEISDLSRVALSTRVNGKVMQNGSTADWVFPLARLLSELSHVMTLEPGDVVTTGTPAGVGLFQKPPVYLKPGDTVELEIEGIGTLSNSVTAP